MNTPTFSPTKPSERLLDEAQRLVQSYARIAISTPEQVVPGAYLVSGSGYPFRVCSVNRKADRAVMERISLVTGERTNRFLAKPLSQLNSNFDWHLCQASKPGMYERWGDIPWLAIGCLALVGMGFAYLVYRYITTL